MSGRNALFIFFLIATAAAFAGGYLWYRYNDADSFTIDSSVIATHDIISARTFLNFLARRTNMQCPIYVHDPDTDNTGTLIISGHRARIDFDVADSNTVLHEYIDAAGVYAWDDVSQYANHADPDTPIREWRDMALPVIQLHSCVPLWTSDESLFRVPENLVLQG